MKNKLIILALFLAVQGLHAQGTFQNLNFEMATLVSSGGVLPYVVASSALPNWTAYIGTDPVNSILYNDRTLGSPAVSIHDTASPFVRPLNGSYSIVLQHSSGGNSASASIGQTGQLPADSLSVVFHAVRVQNLQVTFDGIALPLTQIESRTNYSVMSADISSFAGRTGQLRFTEFRFVDFGGVALDNIRFVPEPGMIALTGIGACLFGFRRWLRGK